MNDAKFQSIQMLNQWFHYTSAFEISTKILHFHRFHKMSAKCGWKQSSTAYEAHSTFQQKFHSVNTEQYGTCGRLAHRHRCAHSVSLIWRRPALKIVVLMLQYQTIDRNFCYWHMRFVSLRSVRSFVYGTLHTAKHSPTCSVQSECFFEHSSFANVFWCTLHTKHKFYQVFSHRKFDVYFFW